MLLSPDESTLLSLQASICSVVFSALTDPSVQLQLIGIRALTVLGSLQGWCLVSLKEAEAGVSPWFWRCHVASGTSSPAVCGCTGAVAAFFTWAMSFRDTMSLPCLFKLGTFYLWCLACCCIAASVDKGKSCWPEHGHLCLWLKVGFFLALVPGFLSHSDLELVADHLIRLTLHEDSQSR